MLNCKVLAFLGKSEDPVTPIHHLHKALTVRVWGQLSLLEGACTSSLPQCPPHLPSPDMLLSVRLPAWLLWALEFAVSGFS